jgi:hypothetical protein
VSFRCSGSGPFYTCDEQQDDGQPRPHPTCLSEREDTGAKIFCSTRSFHAIVGNHRQVVGRVSFEELISNDLSIIIEHFFLTLPPMLVSSSPVSLEIVPAPEPIINYDLANWIARKSAAVGETKQGSILRLEKSSSIKREAIILYRGQGRGELEALLVNLATSDIRFEVSSIIRMRVSVLCGFNRTDIVWGSELY